MNRFTNIILFLLFFSFPFTTSGSDSCLKSWNKLNSDFCTKTEEKSLSQCENDNSYSACSNDCSVIRADSEYSFGKLAGVAAKNYSKISNPSSRLCLEKSYFKNDYPFEQNPTVDSGKNWLKLADKNRNLHSKCDKCCQKEAKQEYKNYTACTESVYLAKKQCQCDNYKKYYIPACQEKYNEWTRPTDSIAEALLTLVTLGLLGPPSEWYYIAPTCTP